MTNPTPPSLALVPTLPVLAFNFEQLKAWAAGVAERYSDLIVTEDGVADAKRDMAEINKAKAAIDTARKEAVRQVSEPIRAFEVQIKEVCGIFDNAYAKLADQVKVFEEARRAEKRAIIEDMILEESDAAYPADSPRTAIFIREEWLNKTASLKSVRGAIKAEVEKNIEAERRQKELEQARQDRSGAIENHVKVLNLRYGFELPITRFLDNRVINDMTQPLADHLTRIEAVFAQEAEHRRAWPKAEAVMPSAPPEPVVTLASPAKTAEIKIRAMSIVLEYSTANEKQVQACLETLKSLCASFGARYRQE